MEPLCASEISLAQPAEFKEIKLNPRRCFASLFHAACTREEKVKEAEGDLYQIETTITRPGHRCTASEANVRLPMPIPPPPRLLRIRGFTCDGYTHRGRDLLLCLVHAHSSKPAPQRHVVRCWSNCPFDGHAATSARNSCADFVSYPNPRCMLASSIVPWEQTGYVPGEVRIVFA